MPRYPGTSRAIGPIPGAVYSALAHKIATFPGEVCPLHVGDTWLEPALGCRMEDLTVAEFPGMHRYAPPQGHPSLIQAICEQVEARSGLGASPSSVLVSTGATGGLGAVAGALLDPGDEVIVLSPFWPLITGIVRCFGGCPIEAPIPAGAASPQDALDVVERLRSERTAALYVSSPNNPTGRRLPRPWLEAWAEWCREHSLWLWADEVYEDYLYEGTADYVRPMLPDRTFSVHSFSKAYGMAGNRCGYVVGPEKVMPELCKVSTHAFYSASTAAQIAAVRALDGRGQRWVDEVRPQYKALGSYAADSLGEPAPEGSTFLFVDVAERLDERGLPGFLLDCADLGLFLAPGSSFGDYPTHVRICFTCAQPDIVRRGVDILAKQLGR